MNSTATKERPILFKAEMVRAILEGRKTQTRRIVKNQGQPWKLCEGLEIESSPYGVPGDLLWVKEAWEGVDEKNKDLTIYKATADMMGTHVTWKSPLFMPRWASRITLEIVSVRVERLNDISSDDCVEEGIDPPYTGDEYEERALARTLYHALWESINGKGSWDLNPWVWVIEFKRIKP